MKTISEYDLAKAIFTHENHELICKRAETNLTGIINVERFNNTRDIMWDQEREKREKAKKLAKAIYSALEDFYTHKNYD
jgi:hypothetical protein